MQLDLPARRLELGLQAKVREQIYTARKEKQF
jgi:hypothetical protein